MCFMHVSFPRSLILIPSSMISPTNVNGKSLSAFHTNLKQAMKSSLDSMKNLLAMVESFESGQTTSTTTTTDPTFYDYYGLGE